MGKEISPNNPLVFNEGQYEAVDIDSFINEQRPKVYEGYEKQLEEVFEITHPELKGKDNYQQELARFLSQKKECDMKIQGSWIFFPWNNTLVHMVSEDDYFHLRTNRNRNLITPEEQLQLYNSCVGVIGLSIGSHMAVGLTYQGIAKHMKIAEFDTLETCNLNRVRATLLDIGKPKLQTTAHQIYESNPYSQLTFFEKGLNKENLKTFLTTGKKPDIIFEAIDDFEMKILLRFACREAGIPVVMFSNLEDSVMIDIERYDLDPKMLIFNGQIGDLGEEILKEPMTEEAKHKYAVKMVGRENVPPRAMESVLEIGKSLVGRPQLSSTVAISGALATYYSRQYILYKNIPNGRKLVKFDDIFLKF